MDVLIQLIVNGLMLAGLYIGLSIGLTLIFGVIKVVNFAHGEFLMIGLYTTYLLTTYTGLSAYSALIPVILLLFVLGFIMQKTVIQPLLNAPPHMQIFATVGVSTFLMNLALVVFGADVHRTAGAGDLTPVSVMGISIVPSQLLTLCVSIVVAILLQLFLSRTFTGMSIKAVSQNRNSAALMGVNVNRVYAITFGLGCACVGLVSVLIARQYPVFPTVGTYFVLVAFVIVVLGGLGNVTGAVLASFIIGIVDSLAGYYVSLALKEVVYFSLFILILIVRPMGLVGKESGA
ncbi:MULTISPECIES: branched-chain amino acid ABC transporter permease [Achromobacter]|uniref:branched-chain amino acid ABC transporter permease n=1 Tax=Achromobacter sp. GbtcB20 TaxID=2824765 RepID=UPI0012668F89